MEFLEGRGGVHFVSRFWKFQRGWGVIGKIPSVGGGMDIFWNCTFTFHVDVFNWIMSTGAGRNIGRSTY